MNRYRHLMVLALGLVMIGTPPAMADMADVDTVDRVATEASISAGYRGTSVHGEPGRALEYDNHESSPTLDARIFTDRGNYTLDLGVNYLGENDYAADAHFDTKGLIRLDLRSERFYHNLDHIPYANGFSGNPPDGTPPTRSSGLAVDGSRPDAWFPTATQTLYTDLGLTIPKGGVPATKTPAYRPYYSDGVPGDDYGLRLDTNEVKLKIKCPDYPAHVTLSYWRYEKQGEKQLRYLSEGGRVPGSSASSDCVGCHMQSKTRKIDRVTEEVKVSADAHVGFVDVVLETLLRTFRDREPIPKDIFGSHSSPAARVSGNYEHSEDPDSRLKEFTVKLNTAPSGGFVASGSFTFGERENRSDLTSVAPVEADIDYSKAAADVTYTPSQNWTFNLRYRLLDLDSENSGTLYNMAPTSAFASPLAVRESMDINRAWYEAVASYRPSSHLTLKAEARREDIDRSGTNGSDPDWELPDEEIITRVKLGFNSRLLDRSALKLSGWLAIKRNDDPAYGTSYEEGQELFLAASYTPSPFWGVLASANLVNEENNDHEYEGYDLARDHEQQNVSLGTWVAPQEGLSFDLNYGYLRTEVDQDMLFGTNPIYAIVDDNADYRQTVQTVTAGMTWQALKDLSCRFEGYHIRSKASFSPDFADGIYPYIQRSGGTFYFPGTASSADLRDISKVDIRQNGVRGRVNWQIDDHLSCAVEATFDDYDEKGNDVFDGSVQSYMASLSYTF